ncbi:uncharacterized protein LOC142069206 [Caretta caretta]|uniref:uncharacterized protein LOC142069206 n=1 Tax=Caretta caretta TaxID=8467 RepID=UPI003F4B9B31
MHPKPKWRMLQPQEGQQETIEPARSSLLKKCSHSLYVSRILHQDKVHMSGKTRKPMKSFVSDLYSWVSTEAEQLRLKSQLPAIGSSQIQATLELVMPEQLAKHSAVPICRQSS